MSTSELLRLARLAWPLVLAAVGTKAMGVVDVAMVGRLGGDAIASANLGDVWSFGGLIFGFGVAMGLDPMVAQAYGAGDPRAAGRAAARESVIMGVVGLLIVAQHLLVSPALVALHEPAVLIPDASRYARILAWSVPAALGFAVVKQFLQGSGQMRPAMWVIALANLINVAANWVLIYGHLGAPTLGVAGSAWATVGSRWFMALALLWLARGTLRQAAPGPGWLDVSSLLRLASQALPVGFQVGLEAWAFIGTTFVMGWLGPTPVAAHAVAISLCSLSFMVPLGISGAAATRVGNLIGAGKPWRHAGWTAIGLGGGVMALSAAVFLWLPGPLVALYTPDPEVVAMAATLLPIAAAFQLVDGTQVTALGVLRGVGDTRIPTVINLVGYWLIALPVGLTATFWLDLGPRGVWYGLCAGLASAALMLVLRVARLGAGQGLAG